MEPSATGERCHMSAASPTPPAGRVIDAHTHLIADRSWRTDQYYEQFSRVWGHIRVPESRDDPGYLEGQVWPAVFDPDGTKLIAEMDGAGIDVSVFMPMDHGLALGEPGTDVYQRNEKYAEIVDRHAGRLYSFVGVDPRREDAPSFFRSAIEAWRMKGLKLYPPTGFFPFDDVCTPLYEIALALDVPVLFHTGFASPGLEAEYSRPIHLDRVANRFPELQIIMGHTAYLQADAWWREAVGVATYKPNVHLELSTWQGWHSDEEFVRVMAFMRDRVGAERILWGSDRTGIPLRVPQAEWVERFRCLGDTAADYGLTFSEDEMQLILGGNTARLYRLEEARNPVGHENA